MTDTERFANPKLLNRKLFRKLKVKTQTLANTSRKNHVDSFVISFPSTGPYSKLTEKQVEPLRRAIQESLYDWKRILTVERSGVLETLLNGRNARNSKPERRTI